MSVKKRVLIFLFVSLFCLAFGNIVPSRIAVLDNRVVSDSEILEILKVERNIEISESDLKEAIARLEASGYFSSITYEYDKSTRLLTIQVKEYPIVEVSVVFDGPKIVEKETLEATSTIKNGKPLNPSRLMFEIPLTLEAMEGVLLSKGYIPPFATIEWTTDKDKADIVSGKITDKIKVTFTVKVAYLWEVTIDAPFSSETVKYLLDKTQLSYLKQYYDTSPLIRWINSKKKYIPKVEDINRAIQAIYSTYYANPNGQWGIDERTYQAMILSFNSTLKNVRQVTLPENVKESSALSMRISFVPVEYVSSPFTLKSVFVEGNVKITKGEIFMASGLIEGQEVDNETAAKAMQAVQDLYTRKEYPFIRLEPVIDPKIGFFSFKITEPTVRDVKVSFVGPQKTKDYLINDKIVIKKNEVLSLNDLRNTYAFLNNTGYFAKVDIVPVPVGKDAIDVEITLEDSNKNNRIGGGGGWQNGLNVYLDLGLLNVWGYGQKISTTLSVTLPLPNNKEMVITKNGTETTTRSPSLDTTIGYSIPKIGGTNLNLDTSAKLKFSGFTTTIDSTDTIVTSKSQETEFLFSLTPIYNISPDQSVGVTAGYEYIRSTSEVATKTKIDGTIDTENVLQSFDGMFTGLSYKFSTRDDIFRPTMGTGFGAGLTLRGLFGKDNKLFLSLSGEYTHFMSIGDPVLGFRIKTDQLFPLSPYGVYRSYLLSPDMYIRVRGSQSIGQSSYGVTVGSAQLRYPLTPETASVPVDLVGFGDLVFFRQVSTGDVIGGNFVADFGVCLDISIPIIGMVRLGYGYNSYLAGKSAADGKLYYGTPFFGFGPAF